MEINFKNILIVSILTVSILNIFSGRSFADSVRCKAAEKILFDEEIDFYISRDEFITAQGRKLHADDSENFTYDCGELTDCNAKCFIYSTM
jgi:hypothetical protein